MKRILCIFAAIALLVSGAFADGGYSGAESVRSERFGRRISLATIPSADGYESADGYAGSGNGHSVEIISKSATVWRSAATGGRKVGSASNGNVLDCVTDRRGNPVSENGFYQVELNGSEGWVNSSYCVLDPLRITLQFSNTMAYAAPDENAKCVGSLAKLTQYTVIGFYDDYLIINLRNSAAYLRTDAGYYDNTFTDRYGDDWQTASVTVSTVMRTGPGDDYPEVKTLRSGQLLNVVDSLGGWLVVRWQDGSQEYFTFVDEGDCELEGNG